MGTIIHWYNVNRKKIWGVIGIIALVISLEKIIEFIWVGNQNEKMNSVKLENKTERNLDSIYLEESKSVVTGKDIEKSQNNELEILNEFIKYCNSGNIEESYNLLSDDSKEKMYPTVEKFTELYYNKIFSGKKKNTSVENWINNIYKVTFIDDALSVGKYNSENNIQDYITVIKDENENYRVNVNSYIDREEINKGGEYQDIKIKVVEKQKYMNYEIYEYEITNNSGNVILLNSINDTEAMYLEDANEIKYNAYMHELSEAELKITSGEKKYISIKYYNKYGSNKNIKRIVFSSVILNYNAYINYQNVGYYSEYGIIKINL